MSQFKVQIPFLCKNKGSVLLQRISLVFFAMLFGASVAQGLSCREIFKPYGFSRTETRSLARFEVEEYLRDRWNSLPNLEGNERMKGIFYPKFERIPWGLNPSFLQRRVRKMAKKANRYLQRDDLFVDFYSMLYEEILRETYDLGLASEISAQGALPRKASLRVLVKRAKRHGWNRLVEVPVDPHHPHGLLSFEAFRMFLKQGELFLDTAGRRAKISSKAIYHSESAHLLQLLFLAHYFESEFGARAVKAEFVPYLATRRGYDLWEYVFDRGGLERTDLRFPAVYHELHLTGQSSLFGLY